MKIKLSTSASLNINTSTLFGVIKKRLVLRNQEGPALRNSKGFTLVELIVVVGVLAILLAVVLVALNPARRFQETNDSRRRSDINAILNAVHSYIADNRGTLAPGLTTSVQQIGVGTGCSGTVGACTIAVAQDNCYDIATNVPNHLAENPLDPQNGTANETGYTIVRNGTTGVVTVQACHAQVGTITISR